MSDLLISLCSGDLETYVAAHADSSAGGAVCARFDHELSLVGVASGEGESLRIENGEGSAEIAWASIGEGLRLTMPGGEEAAANPIEADVEISAGGGDAERHELAGIVWSLPAREGGSLRTAWAAIEGGDLLIFMAARPPGAAHGEEIAACARFRPDGDVVTYEEPLLSTEYDGAGSHRRATLELWQELDTGAAERGGGRRIRGGGARSEAARLEAAAFAWILDGAAGFGGYEIVSG